LQPLGGARYPVRCGALRLSEQPEAYVHVPTASLQLVYDLRLVLPADTRGISLYHVDESLEDDCLVARLERERPDIYLLDPLEGTLHSLHQGQLRSLDGRGLWLSEGFAPQEGWLIRDERIAFEDWYERVRRRSSRYAGVGRQQRSIGATSSAGSGLPGAPLSSSLRDGGASSALKISK